jgi:hypothetical protein
MVEGAGGVTLNLTAAAVEAFYGGKGKDTATAGGSLGVYLNGGDGNDGLVGSELGDFLIGGAGNAPVHRRARNGGNLRRPVWSQPRDRRTNVRTGSARYYAPGRWKSERRADWLVAETTETQFRLRASRSRDNSIGTFGVWRRQCDEPSVKRNAGPSKS